MKTTTFWIGGKPATWATKSEKPWKEQLLRQTPIPALKGEEIGIRMRFILPTLTPWGQPLDVDNLCEPVFAILVNKVGWFNGNRSNIQWWQATKEEGTKPGCHFAIYTTEDITIPNTVPDYDHTYSGTLPRNARSPGQIRWAWDMRRQNKFYWIPQSCDMNLDFADPNIDIGNISNYGITKPTIDCLYPWLGGQEGQPDDHRIMNLAISKASKSSVYDGVRIRLWARGRIDSSLKNQSTFVSGSEKNSSGSSNHSWAQLHPTKITNPCVQESRKWIVCEGALAEKTVMQVQSDLEDAHPGSGKRIKEYISDLRHENRLNIVIENGRLFCKSYLA